MSEELLSKILDELKGIRQEQQMTNERLDNIENRLDSFESRLAKLEDKIDTANRQISEMYNHMNRQFDELTVALRVHDKHIRRLDHEAERLNLKLEKGRQ